MDETDEAPWFPMETAPRDGTPIRVRRVLEYDVRWLGNAWVYGEGLRSGLLSADTPDGWQATPADRSR